MRLPIIPALFALLAAPTAHATVFFQPGENLPLFGPLVAGDVFSADMLADINGSLVQLTRTADDRVNVTYTIADVRNLDDLLPVEIGASPKRDAVRRDVDTPFGPDAPFSVIIGPTGKTVKIALFPDPLLFDPASPPVIRITETVTARPAPIPLPAGVWLLLAGIGGLGLMGHRRK